MEVLQGVCTIDHTESQKGDPEGGLEEKYKSK
jgi:hypothetical protein